MLIDTMLLSNLLSGQAPDTARGIVCDILDFAVPEGLSHASFVAQADGVSFDIDFLDVVIAYKTAGVEVSLEIPADFPVSVPQVMSVVTPLGCNIVLTPDGVELPIYLLLVRQYVEGLVAMPSFSKQIHPVADCLGAFIRRRLGVDAAPFDLPGPGAEQIACHLLPGDIERLEHAVVSGFQDALGGTQAFADYIDLHVAGVYESSHRRFTDIVANTSLTR